MENMILVPNKITLFKITEKTFIQIINDANKHLQYLPREYVRIKNDVSFDDVATLEVLHIACINCGGACQGSIQMFHPETLCKYIQTSATRKTFHTRAGSFSSTHTTSPAKAVVDITIAPASHTEHFENLD